MSTENKNYLQKLIDKLLTGNASRKEIEKLFHFFLSHQAITKWPDDLGKKEVIEEKIFKQIVKEAKIGSYKKGKVRKLNFYHLLKYAAVVAIIATSSYYFTKYFTKEKMTNNPSFIINNEIKVVTDKATLTLEDGSNVELEKGITFEHQNIVSDGEKIIYTSDTNQRVRKEEIAFNYLTVPRGGEFFIELSDNTKVWLNADSKLKYPVKFIDGQPRNVELVYGEAFFDVSSSSNHNGANFSVISQEQKIEVLGTKFNVKAYNNDTSIETILLEGSVVIEVNNKLTTLRPNEQFIFDKNSNEIVINEIDADFETSWFKGYYRFQNKPFGEISKVLERWYDVKFHFDNQNLKQIKFQGQISKHKNIENFLITIKNIENINYKINEKEIYIK